MGLVWTGHVLDAAQYADTERMEMLDDAFRVEMCCVLRADDDDCAGQVERARDVILQVRRARRQVDHQEVELAPVRSVHELLQRHAE